MIKADNYNDVLNALVTAQRGRGISDASCTTVTKDTVVSEATGTDNATLIGNQSRLCYTDVPLPASEMPERGRVVYRRYIDGLAQLSEDYVDLIACSDCFGTCFNGCSGTCSSGCSAACQGSCGRRCQGSCSGEANGWVAGCTFLFPGAQAAAACGSCTNGCDGSCNNGCSGGCANGCSGGCARGCKANCYDTCKNSCSNGCANTARIGSFPYQDASAGA